MAVTRRNGDAALTPSLARALSEPRGEFFRILLDGLPADDRRWVLERITHYATLNAEAGDPARF